MTDLATPQVAQTLWAELLVATLADAGIVTCVISPGSRSTPLVTALVREPRLALVTIIDERAAAFYALGAARATGLPVAMVCTSGTAAAHYLPAIVEASLAGVPLLAITADRPPELHDCGASQTIDQIDLYGNFVRSAIDLGAPVASDVAMRALRRKVIQAVTLACGPMPGPVHLEVPLRKPLEPAAPSTAADLALASATRSLRGEVRIAPPRLACDPGALDELARAIGREPAGVIVAGALPASFAARDAVFALAARVKYPIIAEATSQLRLGARPADVVFVDHFDLIAELPEAALVLQLGAEPVAASWPAFIARRPARHVLAGHAWHDPEATARAVILGDVGDAIARLAAAVDVRADAAWPAMWATLEAEAQAAIDAALAAHPRSETATIRAAIEAVPAGATIQLGNSLPIRVIDHAGGGGPSRAVLAQRGAAGIDGLIASAAGATCGGVPVLLVLGDVSFAHDLGGLLAARTIAAPLAILVVDNRGGQIFAGLPVARAELGGAFDTHWLTPPGVDPAAIASALGLRAITAASPAATASAVATALATPGVTVIHAPVSVSGAHDVRRMAIELVTATAPDRRAWRTS